MHIMCAEVYKVLHGIWKGKRKKIKERRKEEIEILLTVFCVFLKKTFKICNYV